MLRNQRNSGWTTLSLMYPRWLLLLLQLVLALALLTGPTAIQASETLDGKVVLDGELLAKYNSSEQKLHFESKVPSGAAAGAAKKPQKKKRRSYPTAHPRPRLSSKRGVEWLEEYHSFSLKASVDDRFRIRHAPIPEAGSPWPMPQTYRPEQTVFLVRNDIFEFHASGETCDILDYAFQRIRRNTFGDSVANKNKVLYNRYVRQSSLTEIWHLNVTVLKECTVYPHLSMDESYDLEVKRTGASIIAREVWGALRGMETFSQIVYQDPHGRFLVNKTFINDYPRFAHRGILLDTARHYLRKDTILMNLEAMAQNKMNVFHWHITDDQSFPFESKAFPNVTRMGSYDPITHIYSHQDIEDILEEARLRGIRVIPEFDTPGHTYSWGYGRDYLLTPCYDYKREPDGYYGPVNPILKSTYRFLKVLFSEILSVFPEKYIHLGGDEVPFDCWSSNPFITHFMKRNNLSDMRDLLGLYERKLLDLIEDIGSHRKGGSGTIVWQEVFDNGVKLKPDSIVQIWMGDTWDIDRVTSAGYRTIFSTCWYLDYTSYGQDWDKYYNCDQIGVHMDEYGMKNESLLIGGEACLWTEYADDASITPRLWPRASAAAERLWSNRKVNVALEAAPRIEQQRCRMIRRGISAGVLGGPGNCPDYSGQRPASAFSLTNMEFWWPQQRDFQMREGVANRGVGGESASGDRNTVYVVDMNAMYVIPLIVLVLIVCLTLLSVVHDSNKSRIVAILTYPVTGSSKKRGVRGLLYGFLIFAVIWCVWTAPIWLNAWERTGR